MVGQNVFIAASVILGRNVHVQNNVSLYDGVCCEDDVFIGPSAVFTNVRNPRSAVSRKNEYLPTFIRKGATIGANATIICGNEIGAYAFIGAGAVITKPVAAFSVVQGNPAIHSGWISAYGEKLNFDENGRAVCGKTGEQYELRNNSVTRLH